MIICIYIYKEKREKLYFFKYIYIEVFVFFLDKFFFVGRVGLFFVPKFFTKISQTSGDDSKISFFSS